MRFFILLNIVLFLASGCNSTQDESADTQIWGIDLSRHQSNINWDKVLEAESKPQFIFLKTTEGTIINDPSYQENVEILSDQKDILWGAYHFFGHRTSGKEQAKSFIRQAKLSRGNLRPVLDIEPHRFMTDTKRMVKEAKAFCKTIHNYYGVNPIIYCSTKFYESYLKKDFSEKDYVLWIADYRKTEPDHIDWTIWQHTDSYKLEGIKQTVDRNVFKGSLKELRKLLL